MKEKSQSDSFHEKKFGGQTEFDPPFEQKDFFGQLISLFEHSRISPEDAKQIYAFGYRQYQQGQYLGATDTFLYLMIYSNVDTKILKALGACYQATAEFEKALPLYRLCFELSPDDPYIRFYAGECFLRLGKKKEALRELKYAIKLSLGSEIFSPLLNKATGMVELLEKTDLAREQPPG